METLLQSDGIATLFLKNIFPDSNFFNMVFSFFSLRGNSILIWLFIMGFTIYLEERRNPGISTRDKKFTFYFFASFLLTSVLAIFIFKDTFQRPRPYVEFDFIAISSTCPADFSFPSAHAATAFAAAAVLTYFDKKRRLFYYLIALSISYSRIYLGCHYLLDVVGGAVIGWAISKIIIYLFEKRRT
jgi:undecaprenyl-diphosphatase